MGADKQVMRQGTSSWQVLDYLSGSHLPEDKQLASLLLQQLQTMLDSETLTGIVSGQFSDGVEISEHLEAWRKWQASAPKSGVQSLAAQAREGRPIDRVAPRASFEPLQEWEGYIVSLSEKGFRARLLDLNSNDSRETEEADFLFEDVSEDDAALVAEGAVFRWAVGYEKKINGSRQKVSSIVFRRLPIWRASEIAAAKARAADIVRNITWE